MYHTDADNRAKYGRTLTDPDGVVPVACPGNVFDVLEAPTAHIAATTTLHRHAVKAAQAIREGAGPLRSRHSRLAVYQHTPSNDETSIRLDDQKGKAGMEEAPVPRPLLQITNIGRLRLPPMDEVRII